jgi:hypothetical protein
MPTSPLRIGPRIQETTTTTGTGALTLAGATDQHFPFSAIQVGFSTAISVPYLLTWTGGVEWGLGEISADGTTLSRAIVSGVYPGNWRNGAPGGQANLPAGTKTVSLVVLDGLSLVATGGAYTTDDPTGDVPPTCVQNSSVALGIGALSDGDGAVAAGYQAWVGAPYGVAIGALAYATHPFSRVIGSGGSMGDSSLTVGFEETLFGEQLGAGQAVSGTPFTADFAWLMQNPDALWWIDLTAIGANVARTQFRAIRRSLLVQGTTLQVTGSDTVLVSTLATVPTVTCTIGASPDGNGNLPLHVSASSSGATAVDWRISATVRGG